MLGGTADFADYDLAFEGSKDHKPELDYPNTELAWAALSNDGAKPRTVHIDNTSAVTDQALGGFQEVI